MEPVSLILTALVAGAAAAAKDTAGRAVKDSYEGLKTLLKRKLEGDSVAQVIVDAKPHDIEQAKDLLEKKISNVGIDKDVEILKAAEEVMKNEDPEGASTGKYDFRGVMGLQLGNHNTQTNNFK